MDSEQHWNRVYQTKPSDAVSWYAPHLARSLELIDEAGLAPTAALIDVGGGASTLPADLLDKGFSNITVVDISSAAVAAARVQLGERADAVKWIVGDVTRVALPESAFDLWHDRAVFHFLTDEADRQAYLGQVLRSLKPGGRIIVATFGPKGPERCSGLEVIRYDDEALLRQFGSLFQRLHCIEDRHTTPWGSEQEFVYCLCRRR